MLSFLQSLEFIGPLWSPFYHLVRKDLVELFWSMLSSLSKMSSKLLNQRVNLWVSYGFCMIEGTDMHVLIFGFIVIDDNYCLAAHD
ncbi:hypothetical protein KCU93_g401, partial [Aureobasidium melanogenum]